jgi:non-ribosomal peptide synthetase component E (peptide arylation enzyme)
LIEDVRAANKSLRHIITARAPEKSDFMGIETLIEQSRLSPANLQALADRRPDPMEASIILPTGGTTGVPKAVPRTHNDYITFIEYHAKAWEITSADTILTVAPVSHSQGMQCGVGGSFFNYGKYVLCDSTNAEDICRMIERERVKSVGASVFQLPERIEVIEELSMTKVGKVDKKKLREEIKKKLEGEGKI